MYYRCTFRDCTQILMCRDLEDPQTIEDYRRLMPPRVRLVYSDPPWNPGNATYWRTHAQMAPCPSYDRFLDAFISVVGLAVERGAFDLLIEQSINEAHSDYLLRALERNVVLMPLRRRYEVIYSGRPNALFHFGMRDLHTDPTGMSEDEMTLRACVGVWAPVGSWVVEPCVGKGMTSRAAHALGWNLIGSELAQHRLDITLKWLERRGYRVEERYDP